MPILTQTEARNRDTFLALMWALSHPGRVYTLGADPVQPPANLLAIGETLLDLETTFFSPDADLSAALARTTARPDTADSAMYHFYPHVRQLDLMNIEQASVGDMLYPDRAATLIMGCTLGAGATLTLRGPGIQDQQSVRVDGVPDAFWSLRDNARHYPLGWDLFLVSGAQVVGIPRTTEVEIDK